MRVENGSATAPEIERADEDVVLDEGGLDEDEAPGDGGISDDEQREGPSPEVVAEAFDDPADDAQDQESPLDSASHADVEGSVADALADAAAGGGSRNKEEAA